MEAARVGERGGDVPKGLRHVLRAGANQPTGGKAHHGVGAGPQGEVRFGIPVVKYTLCVDEPRQEVAVEVLSHGSNLLLLACGSNTPGSGPSSWAGGMPGPTSCPPRMITNYGWSISFEGSGISADWLG
jgi:hypothetical protein